MRKCVRFIAMGVTRCRKDIGIELMKVIRFQLVAG